MPVFSFKQFTIHQDRCAMKVGTDGVLLGAWAEACKGNILDIGTGTGLIALMLAQRSPLATITGIDIDEGAIQQAQENVHLSPWTDRITILRQDILTYQSHQKYQEIVSNPPFFLHSPANSSAERDTARIASQQLFEGMAKFAENHLTEDGVFEVILPTDIAEDFIYLLWQYNLYLKKQTFVFTKEGKPSKRSLLCFARQPVKPVKDSLYLLDKAGNRTKDYQLLTKDFYL